MLYVSCKGNENANCFCAVLVNDLILGKNIQLQSNSSDLTQISHSRRELASIRIYYKPLEATRSYLERCIIPYKCLQYMQV